MINRVILVGRLTKDPEIRKTGSGMSVCSFTIAVNRRKSNDGSQPTADFINCVAWNQTADLLGQYVRKGNQIGVEGRIQTRNYDDLNNPGRKVYVTEVVCDNLTFLEPKGSTSQTSSYSSNVNTGYYPDVNPYQEQETSMSSSNLMDIPMDDLPF